MSEGIAVPVGLQKRVLRLVRRVGAVETARRLGLAREPVARIVAGLGVRARTVKALRERLDAAEAR